jgi:hypothetical protein
MASVRRRRRRRLRRRIRRRRAPAAPTTRHAVGQGRLRPDPHGQYYQSTVAGAHEGYLVGPASTDFDLYLYKYINGAWSIVAKAENSGTTETIKYNGTAGYYTWLVSSYSGSGSYDFYLRSLSAARPGLADRSAGALNTDSRDTGSRSAARRHRRQRRPSRSPPAVTASSEIHRARGP